MVITNTIEQTLDQGKKIASQLKGGDIVLLSGELGAGKTTLTKGIAEYFGINIDDVVSPSFTLMQIYDIKSDTASKLVHIDTYRLKNEEDLIEIGAHDYVGDPECITIIEWPEKLKTLLKNKNIIAVTVTSQSEKVRIINVE